MLLACSSIPTPDTPGVNITVHVPHRAERVWDMSLEPEFWSKGCGYFVRLGASHLIHVRLTPLSPFPGIGPHPVARPTLSFLGAGTKSPPLWNYCRGGTRPPRLRV